MATLVKFLLNNESEAVYAFFPQLNYNKYLYGNKMKVSYEHYGQHGGAHLDYVKESKPATESEYMPLKQELESIGYNLKICK